MKYTYAVIGVGRTGTATIYDLLKYGNVKKIHGFDISPESLSLCDYKLACTDAPGLDRVSFHQRGPSIELLQEIDIVISCAPYSENLEITQMCSLTDIPMCDLGGNPKMVSLQKAFANDHEVTVCADCGISPGISNILAVDLAKRGCQDIRVRCGGIPKYSQNPLSSPLNYDLLFSAEGLASEYQGEVPVLEDGSLKFIPALSSVERIDPYHEASPTSNNSPETVKYLQSLGVQNYNYMTIRYNGHWGAVGTLGVRACVDWLQAHQPNPPNPDKLMLTVEGGSMSYEMTVTYDHDNCISAMEHTTAWGITIPAKLILDFGLANRRFCTPEALLVDYTHIVIDELNKRAEVKRFTHSCVVCGHYPCDCPRFGFDLEE